jgi:hypothetical protein
MRRSQEDQSDRLWREKLDACVSPVEAVAALVLVAAFIVSLLVT